MARTPLNAVIFSEVYARYDDTIDPRSVVNRVLDLIPYNYIPEGKHGDAVNYLLGKVRAVLHNSRDSWGDRRWVFIPELNGWRRYAGLYLNDADNVFNYRVSQTESMVKATNRLREIRDVMVDYAERGINITVEEAQNLLGALV